MPPLPDSSAPIIVWFREDLRLADNPALHAAAKQNRPIICLFIHEDGSQGMRPLGGASRWWLDKSLRSLSHDIEQLGGQLTIRAGDGSACLDQVIEESGADAVYWNRRYGEAEREIDAAIKSHLKEREVDVQSFNGRLLVEPWVLKTGSGGFYKVFTPFWKALRGCYEPPAALPQPKSLKGPGLDTLSIDELGLHPSNPDWSTGFYPVWTRQERRARKIACLNFWMVRLTRILTTGTFRVRRMARLASRLTFASERSVRPRCGGQPLRRWKPGR